MMRASDMLAEQALNGTGVKQVRAGTLRGFTLVTCKHPDFGAMSGSGTCVEDAALAMRQRIMRRMAWLDDQDPKFRALVHEVGLNKACQKTGRRVPA